MRSPASTRAAMIFRLEKGELAEQMEAQGFGKHDLPKLERGDPKMPLTPARRTALSRLLGMPERWFTEPIADLVSEKPEPSLAARLDSIEAQLRSLPDQLARAVDQIVQGLGRDTPTTDEADDPPKNDEEDELPPAQAQR